MSEPARPALLPTLLVLALVGALWALVGLLYAGLFRPAARPLVLAGFIGLPFAVALLGYRLTADGQADWTQHAVALGIGAFLFYFLLTF